MTHQATSIFLNGPRSSKRRTVSSWLNTLPSFVSGSQPIWKWRTVPIMPSYFLYALPKNMLLLFAYRTTGFTGGSSLGIPNLCPQPPTEDRCRAGCSPSQLEKNQSLSSKLWHVQLTPRLLSCQLRHGPALNLVCNVDLRPM